MIFSVGRIKQKMHQTNSMIECGNILLFKIDCKDSWKINLKYV